jgi:DGQHR domain-containing protein
MTASSKGAPEQRSELIVHALRSRQGEQDLFAFFLPGGQILQVADIARLGRNGRERLKGFQRPEIRQHVKSIVEYLHHRSVIFPNAIILAVSPTVKFTGSRGPDKASALRNAHAGYLRLPLRAEGERVAWIVDGQQRSIALSRATNTELPVPVVAFVCGDLEVQRQQFILVNKARPLPHRLIDELLPETSGVVLPHELASRRIPSALCNALAEDKLSPFYGLIRRPSMSHDSERVVLDSAVTRMIRDRINHPLGALAPFKTFGETRTNVQRMYQLLFAYWAAVKEVFPDAWGKPAVKSRLMHSAGIAAMGVLMDRIIARLGTPDDLQPKVRTELRRIARKCAWTEGTWPLVQTRWDAIESTPRDIRTLSDVLVRLYSEASR